MIRTEAMNLTSIKGLAFRQKLQAGGAGITIITTEDTAVFTINKRDGACIPYGKVNGDVFVREVVNDALEVTKGLPYKRLGSISKAYSDNHYDEGPADIDVGDSKADIDVVASAEYREFIAQYTDKNGRFSYQLMNKELIQFASKSSIVSKKLAEMGRADEIIRYIVRSKAADLARNRGMSEEMLSAFIDTFDSMNTRSAFKELNAYLRGKMSRKKNPAK